jgi:hypothetical protein
MRLWPFEDRQPIGGNDFLLTGLFMGTILWPPFFGMLQLCCCLKRLPHPFRAEFATFHIGLLILSGAALGLLVAFSSAFAGRFRSRRLRRALPILASMALIGFESSLLPFGVSDGAVWRGLAVRCICGALIAAPGGWTALQLALKTSSVHPYRDQIPRFPGNSLPS